MPKGQNLQHEKHNFELEAYDNNVSAFEEISKDSPIAPIIQEKGINCTENAGKIAPLTI